MGKHIQSPSFQGMYGYGNKGQTRCYQNNEAHKVLAEIAKIAFVDDLDFAKVVTSKLKALELLGKHLGMFKELTFAISYKIFGRLTYSPMSKSNAGMGR
jgi:aspartate carbamoyltransferase catalytic subunit